MTGLGVEGEGICDFADRGVAAARFFVSEIVRIVRGVVAVQLGIFVRIFVLRGGLERGGVGGLGLAELGLHWFSYRFGDGGLGLPALGRGRWFDDGVRASWGARGFCHGCLAASWDGGEGS